MNGSQRETSPATLLTLAAALFVAPAVYMVTAFMFSRHGSLGGVSLSGEAEVMIWAAGGASLLAPFVIKRALRASQRSAQLILILAVTVAASFFGLVLSFATGRLAPVRLLGAASMLEILGWSWAFRDCFRANPLDHVARRFTTALLLLGIVYLVVGTVRLAIWNHTVTSATDAARSGFVVFIDAALGVAALSTARLRKLGSAYARSATQVLSWALLVVPVLGTLTSLYWIFAVRKQEGPPAAAAEQPGQG